MSTRSVTTVRSKCAEKEDYKIHASIYRHHDGYPEGQGKWLHEFLDGMVIVNGLTGEEPPKYANGPGRLAAQITAALLADDHEPYLLNHDGDCGQEYEYRISVEFGSRGGTMVVEVFDGPICKDAERLFNGTVEEFGAWIDQPNDQAVPTAGVTTTDSSTHTAPPVDVDRLVRDCRVTKTDGSYYDGSYRSWQEPAIFHGWTKHARCAVGDGSMIDWITLAIIEWPDGNVDMCEPCALQFVANDKLRHGGENQ